MSFWRFVSLALLVLSFSACGYSQIYSKGLLAEYHLDCSGVSGGALIDYSSLGNTASVVSPVCDSQEMIFSRTRGGTGSVSLPAAVTSKIAAFLICADASSNLSTDQWGLQPLFGTDDPNGLYAVAGQYFNRQTQFIVNWRGQSTAVADNAYGPACYLWSAGTSPLNPDTILINGELPRKYTSRVDMGCQSGCMIPGAPLSHFGNGFLGYVGGQWQDIVGQQTPAQLSGKEFFAAFWSSPIDLTAAAQSTAYAMQRSAAAGVNFKTQNTSTANQLITTGDSRVTGFPDPRPCYGAGQYCGGPAPWPNLISSDVGFELHNYAVSGQFCDDLVESAYGKEDPTFSLYATFNVDIWFCGTSSLNIQDSHARSPSQLFDLLVQWNAARQKAGAMTGVITEPYRAGPGFGVRDSDSLRIEFNSLIYKNSQLFDFVVDAGSDPVFGSPSGMTPGRYSVDGIHFTAEGNARLADLVNKALAKRLFGKAQRGSPILT
jgi:hypothetical protein